MGIFLSLSKSTTLVWLGASEWALLIFGALLVVGLIIEYRAQHGSRWMKFGELLVIIGVAGELLGDGGIFLFSRQLQIISDQEIAAVTREAGEAKRSAESAASAAFRANASAETAEKASENALALARSTAEYATWRTISKEQADILVKHLAPLKGESILVSLTAAADSETVRFFGKLCTVLDTNQVGMKVTVPLVADIHRPGLSFVVFKNREKDFELIVGALDKASIEKADIMRKTADHRPAVGNSEGDGALQLNVGAKH